jgi:MerR family transcriptional regulator, light-induced transcriptional regulator
MNAYTNNQAMSPSNSGSASKSAGSEAESHAYTAGSQALARLATDANREVVELRLAVLSRAIEHEIIPRLMLAHPTVGDCLSMTPAPSPQVSADDVIAFANLVLAHDENVAHACIETMRSSGISVETIYTDLLAPVARHLGKLWEDDLCDFTEVTLGLGRLHQVLRELSPAFSQSNQTANGRRALLLPAPGEQHTFGLVMVSEFFRRAGWDVGGGPWEAGADPVTMVKSEWFDVVGFSLGDVTRLDALAECITQIRKSALNKSISILVGGPLFLAHPEYVSFVNADAASTDGAQAPTLAARLVASQSASKREASHLLKTNLT